MLFILYDVNAMCKCEISVPLKIENEDCLMQLDTGCALSPSPLIVLKQVCPEAKVKPTRVVLSKYTGETVHPLREVHVKVEYRGSQDTLPLLILHEGTTALFGQNWLSDIHLDWKTLPGLNHIRPIPSNSSGNTVPQGNRTLR